MDGFLGEIRTWASSRIPVNWMPCYGQKLDMVNYQPLFAVIDTLYGGDGKTDFALPDMRAKVMIGAGEGPGLTNRNLGSTGSEALIKLTVNNIAPHTHDVTNLYGDPGVTGRLPSMNDDGTVGPENAYPAISPFQNYSGDTPAMEEFMKPTPTGDIPVSSVTVEPFGLGEGFNSYSPYQTIGYIICVNGSFPPRN